MIEGSVPYFWLIDPDPGGPKTCGSGGSGFATLENFIRKFCKLGSIWCEQNLKARSLYIVVTWAVSLCGQSCRGSCACGRGPGVCTAGPARAQGGACSRSYPGTTSSLAQAFLKGTGSRDRIRIFRKKLLKKVHKIKDWSISTLWWIGVWPLKGLTGCSAAGCGTADRKRQLTAATSPRGQGLS